MSGHRVSTVCIGLLLALSLGLGRALADDDRGTHYTLRPTKGGTSYSTTVTTGSQGVWIDVRGRQSSAGVVLAPGASSGASVTYASAAGSGYPSAGSNAGSAGSAVTRSWTNAQGEPFYQTKDGHIYHLEAVNISFASSGKDGWFTTGTRLHPGDVPVGLYIDGTYQGIVWIPVNGKPGNVQAASAPSGSATGAGSAPIVVDPYAVAVDVLRHVPLPDVGIRVNPALGLVGMPGWFWAEGYDGQPFGGSATVGSYTVTVQVQPTGYLWDFGDGTTLVTHSLGQPYPAESDVQHTYQYSSLGYPAGFPVRLTMQLAASYSVNGGPAAPLSGMAQTYTASYRVQEVQSLLTSR